jgi:hypothetical protein
VPASQTYQQITDQIKADGFAVVEMTPGEFTAKQGKTYLNSANQTMLTQLTTLLQTLKANGMTMLLLNEMQFTLNPVLAAEASHLDATQTDIQEVSKSTSTFANLSVWLALVVMAAAVIV